MKLLLEYPVKDVRFNQIFGENKNPIYQQLGMKGHNGIDFYAPDGTPVYASHDGVVTYAGLDGSNGNLIVIMTEDMFDYNDEIVYFKTLYCHLKTGTYKVTANQKVKAGDLIALADNTGASSGSHLHFGCKPVKNGEEPWQWYNLEQDAGYNGAIDPMSYFPEYRKFTVPLKFGDSGSEVEKVQSFLINNGYMQIVPRLGFYGEITSKAVLDFQIKNCDLSWYERYVLRGKKVGEKTLAALNKF